MLIHSTISQSPPHPQTISLSSFFPNSINFPSGFRNLPLKRSQFKPLIVRNCSSVSQVYNFGTVDYEKKKPVGWKSIYKRISMMGNREKGSSGVLNQWENEGNSVTKWELCRLVKELRKYGRFKLALEVYDWMNKKPERFIMAPSDAAIQLDLISKIDGVSGAENYFNNLPDDLIDKRVYGSLLNAYVHTRKKEKAESLLLKMKEKDYANHALPYNVMMTLYMNLKDYEKVEAFVSEMMQNNIDLDLYTYSIWITSRGSQGSVEKLEQVFEKMKLDVSVKPNWTTYSTLSTVYIKLGDLEKAQDCLKMIENKISGRYRIPYHYLLSHYGSIGKKEEVKRIWETYKTVFQYIPNMGYHAVISAFVRMDEIGEAENLYDEWLSVKTTYDARIGNRLLGWYVRSGHSEKAESFFEEMLETGKANSSTWEIIGEGHIRNKRISDALACFEKALSHEESRFWKPKPVNVSLFFKLCEQERDEKGKEAMFEILRQTGVLEDELFMSKLTLSKESTAGNEQLNAKQNEDENRITKKWRLPFNPFVIRLPFFGPPMAASCVSSSSSSFSFQPQFSINQSLKPTSLSLFSSIWPSNLSINLASSNRTRKNQVFVVQAAWTRRSRSEAEKRPNKKSWKQRTDMYMRPFQLNIFFSKRFIHAKVMHRGTSKVVSVATTNAKDLRNTLPSLIDNEACRVIGRLIAERSKEADVYAVAFEAKKNERIEGRLAIVLDTIKDNGIIFV